MQETICKFCKTPFAASKGKVFCSDKCREDYRREYRAEWANRHYKPTKQGHCVYRDWIDCISGNCKKCGWNYDVERARMLARRDI